MKEYWFIAFRNLKRRGVRSWLTLLGIFIGITAVVALISLGSGLRETVNSQFGISSTEVITVQAGGLTAFGPPGTGITRPLVVDDVEAIEDLSSVERAVRRNIPSGKLEFKDEVIFGITMSIPDGDDRKFVYEQIGIEIEQGRLLEDGDTNKVVLGNNFFTESVGLNNKIEAGDKVEIQGKEFEVVGITKKKGSFIFDNVAQMNEDPLEELMGYGDDVDLIAVKIKDKDLIDKAKEEIEELMRDRRDVDEGEEDFEVTTPQATLDTVNGVLAGIQVFIVLIAAVSIIVGGIGIVNTMTTSVLERKKEIGIMKAIGAKNSDIFYQFFIEAGLLGFIGGLAGVIAGVLIGYLGTLSISQFIGATTQPEINIGLIIAALAGSFIIGSIAGIVPAMRAARQNPVDALRG